MTNRHSFGFSGDGAALCSPRLADYNLTFDLPCVPVMPETLLLLELQAREHSADLAKVSKLILADLGATLQVLCLAVRDCSMDGASPRRIEDCISAVGVEACLEALSRQTFNLGARRSQVMNFWRHAGTIAAFCRFLAEEMYLPVDPEEAYLVGLFHDLAALPSILGWKRGAQMSRKEWLPALRMAESWSLPECVVEYFWECAQSERENMWASIVDQAHALESTPTDSSPLGGFYFRLQPETHVATA